MGWLTCIRAPISTLVPSMLQSCGTQGRAPYRGVLTLVHARRKGHEDVQIDRQHHRAETIVKQYGADILLWVAQTDYTNDHVVRRF